MHRHTLAISAVLVTAAVASFVLLFAGSEARTQTTSPEESSVSQGSLPGPDAPPGVIAAMESPTDYSQAVDNASPGRFEAPGWDTASSAQGYYGESYSVEDPAGSSRPARFKVKIPADDYYSVYAWWPADAGNSTAARFGVSTVSGIKWTEVNQRRDGGDWVKIGDYRMKAGDSYAIQISPDGGSGAVVADAVAVVRGAFASPPKGQQVTGGEQLFRASGGRTTGGDVVRVARKHIGTRYRNSPPYPCRAYRKEDCSCHTKVVFKRFGKHLRDNPRKQWERGTVIHKRRNVRRGDLVFFDENRNGKLEPWDHVGIYSGNGYLVHASNYFNKVVESKMKYIRGFWGARRISLR